MYSLLSGIAGPDWSRQGALQSPQPGGLAQPVRHCYVRFHSSPLGFLPQSIKQPLPGEQGRASLSFSTFAAGWSFRSWKAELSMHLTNTPSGWSQGHFCFQTVASVERGQLTFLSHLWTRMYWCKTVCFFKEHNLIWLLLQEHLESWLWNLPNHDQSYHNLVAESGDQAPGAVTSTTWSCIREMKERTVGVLAFDFEAWYVKREFSQKLYQWKYDSWIHSGSSL